MLYITSPATYLLYNWKFVHFDPPHPFLPLQSAPTPLLIVLKRKEEERKERQKGKKKKEKKEGKEKRKEGKEEGREGEKEGGRKEGSALQRQRTT